VKPNLASKEGSCCFGGGGSLLPSLGSLVSHRAMMHITQKIAQRTSLGNVAYSLIDSNLEQTISHNHIYRHVGEVSVSHFT